MKGLIKDIVGKLFRWGRNIFFIIIVIIIVSGIIKGDFKTDDKSSLMSSGFDIKSYNVILDVKEDNKVYVTENITVHFKYSNKHGIYKFTPQWLEYTGRDGKIIKRKSKVKDLVAIGDPYIVDTVKKKARIKIGDPDEYVGLGDKSYTIKYVYDMGRDPFKGFDEFIFHAFGDYWGTDINNASIQVNMPKDISVYNINFFLDKYRETSANEFVDYNIVGNTLFASFNREKYREYLTNEYCSVSYHIGEYGDCTLPSYYDDNLEESLTLDIELPNGYFKGGSWNYGLGSFLVCVIIFILTFYSFIRWKKYGKDFPKQVPTIEFYPPDNYSAAEIGYIYNKQTSKKLTISLIIQLASKGYIKIDETKEKKIMITNLVDVHNKQVIDNNSTRVIEVRKLKEADNSLGQRERMMMSYLFKRGNQKRVTNNINLFLKSKDILINGGYIEIVNDNQVNNNKTLKSTKLITRLEEIVYDKLFNQGNVVILSEHKTFYKVFDEVDQHLNSKIKNLIDDGEASWKMIVTFFVTGLVVLLSYLSYCVIEDMDPSWNIIYILSFVCIFINLFFAFIMKRKTEYGQKINAQIKGFREFLINVEKDKLEDLVMENPDYFYDILPYTYVLDISKKWIKNFEDIPLPEVDMGTYDFNNVTSFYNVYDNIYYPAPTNSSGSGSSGCSSCGGGCSSCGGGCSSCGGGGSW